jgi:hypothetical protein
MTPPVTLLALQVKLQIIQDAQRTMEANQVARHEQLMQQLSRIADETLENRHRIAMLERRSGHPRAVEANGDG